MRNIELATLTMEEGFIKKMKTEGEPYIKARSHRGFIYGCKNLQLCYRYYQADNPKGDVTIVHGFSEFGWKYSEMIYLFLLNGYSVYIMDHRGHGLSQRETSDLQKVYVRDFREYVIDLHRFYRRVIVKNREPHYLFSHSMGGNIAGLYLETYPHDFKKAVLSSPMVRVKAGRVPALAMRIVSAFEVRLGHGSKFTIGQGGFDASYKLDTSSCMSKERYEYTMGKRKENIFYQTWGGSYAWLYAACRASESLEAHIEDIEIPCLVFAAGQDRLVDANRICALARKIPECRLIRVPNSRHEIFNAGPRERKNYYRQVLKFFAE